MDEKLKKAFDKRIVKAVKLAYENGFYEGCHAQAKMYKEGLNTCKQYAEPIKHKLFYYVSDIWVAMKNAEIKS